MVQQLKIFSNHAPQEMTPAGEAADSWLIKPLTLAGLGTLQVNLTSTGVPETLLQVSVTTAELKQYNVLFPVLAIADCIVMGTAGPGAGQMRALQRGMAGCAGDQHGHSLDWKTGRLTPTSDGEIVQDLLRVKTT